VRETIRLLRYSRTDADYETLGKLLRLTDIQAVFYDTNLAICGNDSLTSELMENIFASNKLILSPILAHLVAGREELAVDVLRQQKDAYSLAEVTYLEKLSQARPSASDDSTAMAIRLITHNQLIKYKPAPGTKCADIKLCLLQFISMNDSALYNQSAFIGLLLLSQEKIGLDYRFLSPKGTLFGNRLYIICEDSLRDLGVDSSNISKQAKLEYKSSLASWMTEHHEFAQDTQVVKALKI